MTAAQQKAKVMVENISCIVPESRTLGGIFLGNVYGAQNSAVLKEYGIRAVLTTSIETKIFYDPISIPFHLKINAHDKQNFSISQHFDECLEFIHKHREITNVFIHCYAGVSRSATILAAYLMKYWNWNSKQALEFIEKKRIVAKPNEGFIQQLRQFEFSLAKNNQMHHKSVLAFRPQSTNQKRSSNKTEAFENRQNEAPVRTLERNNSYFQPNRQKIRFSSTETNFKTPAPQNSIFETSPGWLKLNRITVRSKNLPGSISH